MTSDEGAASPAPEFSRVVQADHVTRKGQVERIEASPAERDALAARLGVEGIRRLTAELRLRRVRGGTMVRVEGRLEAEVVQTCVVTLEPFESLVEETFTALFAPPEMVPEEEYDIEIGFSEEDDPEPFDRGRIDLGELTAQHLSLALDPYPRSPGAILSDQDEEAAVEEEESEEPRRNPFEALAKLKR